MGGIRDARRISSPTCGNRSAAVGADARELEPVLHTGEAVLRRDRVEPGVEAAAGELHHPVAGRAHQVVVVLAAAEPVARLPWPVREDVDDTLLGEDGERAVDGREADAAAACPQALVQLLRRGVVRLAHELGEDPRPLCRRAKPALLQERRGPRLRPRHPCLPGSGHAATLASRMRIVLMTLRAEP